MRTDVALLEQRATVDGQAYARADDDDGSRYLDLHRFDVEAWRTGVADDETARALRAIATDDPTVAAARYRDAFMAGYRAAMQELLRKQA